MNFLQLCQAVARESGTINNGGVLPLTTLNQVGRLSKVVYWTQQAWTNIQNRRSDWRWLRDEWSFTATAGVARYAPSAVGITTRFASFLTDCDGYLPTSIYDPAIGPANLNPMQGISFETWRYWYGRGAQSNGRPSVYAISSKNELCIGPVPDKPYLLQGEYWKGAQTLLADTDTPECPDRFHMIVAWHALTLLHAHDEGFPNAQNASSNFEMLMRDLEQDQLPSISVGASPIA